MNVKVLYLEDEPFLGKIVSESLQARGFNVKLVTSGAVLIETFYNFEPDICVLDVMVPKIDGFTLAREIRAISSNLPIIFLTAKNQISDVIEGFESGGNDYVKKPFSMEELIVRINNLLALQGNAISQIDSEVRQIGAFEFYPSKFELREGSEITKLSHKENELFKILSEHINTKLDRRKVLKKVWGDDSLYNSRNLDVYIRKIRKIFEKDSKIELITLRGYGYHLVIND